MSIRDSIKGDLVLAMKAKDGEKTSVLRLMQSAIKYREIEKRPEPLTEVDVQNVLKKLVKQRQDSIEQFTAAQRQDLADKEQCELVIINSYLPQQLDEAQIKRFVIEAIAETGAASIKDMGKVMQAVLAKAQGNADNRIVSQLVKQSLS